MKKVCNKCNQEKCLENFHKNRYYQDGKSSSCKTCHAKSGARWRRFNAWKKGKDRWDDNSPPEIAFKVTGIDGNKDFCSYCTTRFGTRIQYHGRICILERHKEHILPRHHNDGPGYESRDRIENLTWSCQICNYIKSDLYFDTMSEIQNYILDCLLKSDWKILEDDLKVTSIWDLKDDTQGRYKAREDVL